MNSSIITYNFEETRTLGFNLARKLKGGEVLLLHGDLGSGKTTFVQGLAAGLGIEQRIISPTFIIMRTYEIKLETQNAKVKSASKNLKFFYHIDLYRIETVADIDGLGLKEIMGDPENIVAIEWPEKIEELLPEKRMEFYFTYLEDDKREIRIAEENI